MWLVGRGLLSGMSSDKFSFSFIGLEFFGVIVITRVCLESFW